MASIRERNGKFNVIYSYTDADGKRKQKWETYATKAEAKKRKKEIEYKEEMGSMIIPQCKTMKDLLAEYVALYGKDNWALSTYDGNVSLINNYILLIIGDEKLSEINTRFIEKYYQRFNRRRFGYDSEQCHKKSSFHKYVRVAVQHADDGGQHICMVHRQRQHR